MIMLFAINFARITLIFILSAYYQFDKKHDEFRFGILKFGSKEAIIFLIKKKFKFVIFEIFEKKKNHHKINLKGKYRSAKNLLLK